MSGGACVAGVAGVVSCFCDVRKGFSALRKALCRRVNLDQGGGVDVLPLLLLLSSLPSYGVVAWRGTPSFHPSAVRHIRYLP